MKSMRDLAESFAPSGDADVLVDEVLEAESTMDPAASLEETNDGQIALDGNIAFILAPSGTGKSYFAEKVRENKDNLPYKAVDFDTTIAVTTGWPSKDGWWDDGSTWQAEVSIAKSIMDVGTYTDTVFVFNPNNLTRFINAVGVERVGFVLIDDSDYERNAKDHHRSYDDLMAGKDKARAQYESVANDHNITIYGDFESAVTGLLN